MVSDTNFDARMSRFTLAIFQDSNMYEADPKDSEHFDPGRALGCDYYFHRLSIFLGLESEASDSSKSRSFRIGNYFKRVLQFWQRKPVKGRYLDFRGKVSNFLF